MREIVAADQPFERDEVGRDDGLALFAEQPYKREIIEQRRRVARSARAR